MVDLNNAFTGAATGAGIGAAGGPWGAAAGGLLGGLTGLFGGGKGKAPKIKQMQNFTPEQQAFLDQQLEMARAGNVEAQKFLMSILSDEEGAFEDFERPAMEQFQSQIMPSILERLNIGDNKYRSSVTNSLAQAGRGLSGDLASQRANLKFGAMGQLNQAAQTGLQKRTTPYIKGGEQSAWSQLGPEAGQGWRTALSGAGDGKQNWQNFYNNFRGGI